MLLGHMILLVFGLSLGSFIAACAYRIPRRISVVAVPSSCPECGAVLNWWELIPLVSFMIQKGKCRSCKVNIPWRYPLIEVFVPMSILVLFELFGPTVEFIFRTMVFLFMTVICLIDWEFQIIPNSILVVGGVIGVTLLGLLDLRALLESIFSAFLCFGIVLSIRALANLAFKRESLGLGDVKLAFLLGLFLGFKLFLVAFWIASVFGAIYGLIGGRLHRSEPLPFGSFLALASMLVLTFDQAVVRVLAEWV